MAIDIYTPQVMAPAIEKMPRAGNFLRTLFLGPEVTHPTRDIVIDISTGSRIVAPYVSPLREGKVMTKLGHSTDKLKLPYVKMKYDITAVDTAKRAIGENPFAPISPAARAERLMNKFLAEGNDAIERLLELQTAQGLVTGKVTALGVDDSDLDWSLEIDFQRAAGQTITKGAGTYWSVDTVDPMGDLRAWQIMAMKSSFHAPTEVVMGTTALESFLKNPLIQSKLDNRRIEGNQIDMSRFDSVQGVRPIGSLEGFNIYHYSQWYVHPQTDIVTEMIPANMVILGTAAGQTRNAVNFGAIEDVTVAPGPMELRVLPKSWITEDPAARWLMLQTSPLATFHEPNAFVSAQVEA
jgi:hypothetical protein